MSSYKNGRFGGSLDSSKNLRLLDVLCWKLFHKKTQKSVLAKPPEVLDDAEKLDQKEDFICWLSHASFLIQLGGKRIIVDPVFSDIPLHKRHVAFPYDLETLGEIDYLLVSHTHYDHCDKPSIQLLSKRDPKALIPLKMSHCLSKMAPSIESHELDWYESYEEDGLSVTLVPAKHWGRRGIFDKNRVLWGGYVISYKGKTIYFAGDSAAGEHFAEIGERFEIDIALLPIGAYRPEFIMKENHLNPEEALNAFRQLRAKKMIPMHYGTFKLTDEPIDEPLRWMQKLAKKNAEDIEFLKVGEVFTI